MAGIREFFQALTDTQWDSMVRVVQDLQDSSSVERLESLRNFLLNLTKEIDTINRRRDALGQKVENIGAMITSIDAYLKENPTNIEVILFRFILVMCRSFLRGEVVELRPSEKLEKKYDTERKREILLNLQSLVSSLGLEVRNAQAEKTNVRVEAEE